MRHTYYRIPNSFLAMFDKAAELKLATVFYCLTNAQSEQALNGDYIISVSQETLAKLSGLSVSTIRRTTKKLCAKGFIISQHRPVSNRRTADGSLMLDKYNYIIKYIPRDKDYFCVDKAVLRKANGQAFVTYMLFCKLSERVSRAFYHSLTDLCTLLSFTRTELSKAIKKLVKLKLIRKFYKRTRLGDYTENSYAVSKYQQPETITRENIQFHSMDNVPQKEISPCIRKIQGAEIKRLNCTDNKDWPFSIDTIIQHLGEVVKGAIQKTRGFLKKLINRGSQKNGRS